MNRTYLPENYFNNFGDLVGDMTENDAFITSFSFKYKDADYICIVYRFDKDKGFVKKDKYAFVSVEFYRNYNLDTPLKIELNRRTFCYTTRKDETFVAQYFGIDFSDFYRKEWVEFHSVLGKAIPVKINIHCSEKEKRFQLEFYSKKCGESSDKLYCYGVRRNNIERQRRLFNLEKTRLLRPSLFNWFKQDHHISFLYSENPAQEKDDATILKQFNERNRLKGN